MILSPLAGASKYLTYGATTADSGGTAVTTGGSAGTKGSYVEIAASTEYETNSLRVFIQQNATAGLLAVDIAIGSGGSEVVICPDLLFHGLKTLEYNIHYEFPVLIPAGTRISARAAHETSSSVAIDVIVVVGNAERQFVEPVSSVVRYGGSALSPASVDPGGTAHTDSAWVELTSATSVDHNWWNLVPVRAGTTSADATYLIDLAIGAASSEVEVLSDLHGNFGTTSDVTSPSSYIFPLFIPAGTRVSARMRCSGIAAASRVAEMGLYGA